MSDVVRKIGLWNCFQAILDIICLFIKSLMNKTDVLTEYQKQCDKTTQKLRECLMQTDEGRDLFAKHDMLMEDAH